MEAAEKDAFMAWRNMTEEKAYLGALEAAHGELEKSAQNKTAEQEELTVAEHTAHQKVDAAKATQRTEQQKLDEMLSSTVSNAENEEKERMLAQLEQRALVAENKTVVAAKQALEQAKLAASQAQDVRRSSRRKSSRDKKAFKGASSVLKQVNSSLGEEETKLHQKLEDGNATALLKSEKLQEYAELVG